MSDKGAGSQPAPTGAVRRQLANSREDLLIEEAPLLLDIHGNQLLTMRTPGRDEDLVTGFLLAEGIVPNAASIQGLAFAGASEPNETPDTMRIELAAAPEGLAKARLARTHEVRSSCGVCGMTDPQSLLDDTVPLLPGVPKVARAKIQALTATLVEQQPLFSLTGGCHGALLANASGDVLAAGEDVGRHNALDKAIGQAARDGVSFAECVAVLSGRAGFDLVVKCLRLGIAVIVSVSAPSALAFDLCHGTGATLVGFARGERFQVYCGAERLTAS
ncbi:MAG: formate dehydrogenase accessory sulfurtransferase FdhD [Planctomycetota bacterium]